MSEVIAGGGDPGHRPGGEATELVMARPRRQALLLDHSRRVFLWGALCGRQQGLDYDPELLYVAAMFHDLGLTEKFRRTDRRLRSTTALTRPAGSCRRACGITGEPADWVWTSIALHTTQEIPLHMSAEIALVNRGLTSWASLHDAVSDEQRAVAGGASPPGLQEFNPPPSPRASRTAPRPPSATSRRTYWPTSYRASCASDFVERIKDSDWPE
ncbi:diguanylate cyclase [Streptomyces sp. L7]